MRVFVCLLALLAFSQFTAAQKREEGFDAFFKPTEGAARYYVVTEQKDSLWHRTAWYLPERGQAMEGWYRDSACTVPHGKITWFHSNKALQSTGSFVNGKKEGTWLSLGEDGLMRDSATWRNGRLSGTRLGWSPSGMPTDSSQFDGMGNGVAVRWYEDGQPLSAGRWVSDTVRAGRWNYYHPNGKVMATEDYLNGKLVSLKCFDASGKALDSAACTESEATFQGGDNGWRRFMERNLNPNVPIKNKAPLGMYTVVIQFIVDTEGKITDIRPLTRFGFGMEEEAIRLIRAAPRWNPARQHGRNVKAYRRQPVTFLISD